MQRPQLLAILIVLGLMAAVAAWFVSANHAPPPVLPDLVKDAAPDAIDASATRLGDDAPRHTEETVRKVVDGPQHFDLSDDPEIRAALTGFRGRVVDTKKQPVADCGVRLYRGATSSLLPVGIDPMAEEASWAPDYVAGEVRTQEDGTFLIDRVWPRAFFLLLAGIGTDAPSHRFLQHSPEPGQILDLGDIQLDPCGVLTGMVVDENGDPLAGALVRAVDLPGTVVSMVPVERFDPKGCVLIREPQSPIRVLEMPAWVERAFDHLPIPSAHSGVDGRFRLVGVMPGNNYVATTHVGKQSDIKTAVKVDSGETKDLGSVKLRDGEELSGVVLDTAGKPVANAEVVAGSISGMQPFDFASRIGTTDAEGRFAAMGFAAGKVSVAARRNAKDPWVLADPQAILNDVYVRLPAVAQLTVRVTLQAQVVKDPVLRLLANSNSAPAYVMSLLGVQRPIDVRDRRTVHDDGTITLADLPLGHYVLMAKTEGAAVTTTEIDLSQGNKSIDIALDPSFAFVVRVFGPEDKPVRNATVYVVDHSGNRGTMPLAAGRTDAAGVLRVDSATDGSVRVSAEHPRFGSVHGQRDKEQSELVLRMQMPGWLDGTVTANGKVPEPGSHSVSLLRRSDGARGATEDVPIVVTPGLDGQFTVKALQPGKYRAALFPSADAVRSPGGVMTMMQSMWNWGRDSQQDVEIASGQGTTIELDTAGTKYDGPTGSIFGTIQVDGRLGDGYQVMAWSNGTNRVAVVDAAGRYELAGLPVGSVYLSLQEKNEGMFRRRGIYNRSVELKAAEALQIDIVLATTTIAGYAVRPDGSPLVGAQIQASSRPLDERDTNSQGSWNSTTTDESGRFRFESVSAGIYQIDVRPNGGAEGMRGSVSGIRAEGGRPVEELRIPCHETVEFAGRIDMTVFATKPEHLYLSIQSIDPKNPENHRAGQQVDGAGVEDDGKFSTNDVSPGTYHVLVHVHSGDTWATYIIPGTVVVAPTGTRDALLRPMLEQRPR